MYGCGDGDDEGSMVYLSAGPFHKSEHHTHLCNILGRALAGPAFLLAHGHDLLVVHETTVLVVWSVGEKECGKRNRGVTA